MAYFINFSFLLCPVYMVSYFYTFTRSKYQNYFGSELLLGLQRSTNSIHSMSFALFLFSLHSLFLVDTITVQFIIMFHLLRNKSSQTTFHIPSCPLKVTTGHTKIYYFTYIHSTFSPQVFIYVPNKSTYILCLKPWPDTNHSRSNVVMNRP